jgi:hypothetical protein
MAKKSFILYKDTLCVLDALTMEQRGLLFTAIRDYQDGKELDIDPLTTIAFAQFKAQFVRDDAGYSIQSEVNRQNGKNGGRPRKDKTENNPEKPNGFYENRKKPDSDSDNGSDTDSDSIILGDAQQPLSNAESDEKKKVAGKKKPGATAFTPPTIAEVIAYFAENECNEDYAKKAFNYYSAGDWHDSKGKKIQRWKQKMQFWFDKAEDNQRIKRSNGDKPSQKMKYNPVVGMIPDND